MKEFYCIILLFVMSVCDASNKNPVVSIRSLDGDVIDCIHIYDQPAFDHPLLKNHTILMRPSFHPNSGLLSSHSQENTNSITQPWQLSGKCPDNTIPIVRNQNAKKTKKYVMRQHKNVSQSSSNDDLKLDGYIHEHAIAYVQGGKYHGAKATINVWQPYVQDHGEFSLSQIWLVGGDDSDMNTIEAGWTVDPNLYGDNKPRLFTYWTRDHYQSTGCYNMRCPGFVQTSTKIALGANMTPVSTYHGRQFEISLYLVKDEQFAVWWLQLGNDVVGYWPTSLFTILADSASTIEWGGEVINLEPNGQHTTTQMGSGHFPQEGYKGASYFKNLQVVDESKTLRSPGQLLTAAEKPNCYNIGLGKNDYSGDYFYYGGPGRNAKCP